MRISDGSSDVCSSDLFRELLHRNGGSHRRSRRDDAVDGPPGAEVRAVTWLEQVEAAPYRHGFLAVARRIDVLNRHKPRLGRSLRPLDDAVRFAQEPSVTFAPATLARVEVGAKTGSGADAGAREPDRPTRISTFFFGLFGPHGPLPLHLTEYARDRLRNADDPTFARFADIFHHRMLSLFYRAWADSRPTVQFDRPESARFATYVGALTGRGMPSLRERDAMPDLAKLHFAGRLDRKRTRLKSSH